MSEVKNEVDEIAIAILGPKFDNLESKIKEITKCANYQNIPSSDHQQQLDQIIKSLGELIKEVSGEV